MNRVTVRAVTFADANRTWHHIPLSAYTADVEHCTVYHTSAVVTALVAIHPFHAARGSRDPCAVLRCP